MAFIRGTFVSDDLGIFKLCHETERNLIQTSLQYISLDGEYMYS